MKHIDMIFLVLFIVLVIGGVWGLGQVLTGLPDVLKIVFSEGISK